MAYSVDYIGKNCYLDLSQDASIENSVLGTIIGYCDDETGEHYLVSIVSKGEVIKVYDSDIINIIEDGGGGGGGGSSESTIAWKPTVAVDGTISWTRTSSTTKPADQNIKGEDGFSPTVTITPIQGGNRVTITDADGDHEFDVMDGSGSGSGNADFDITPEHNIAATSANGEHLIFDFTETDTLETRASIPGSYEKRRILATKDYVDSKYGGTIDVVPGDDKFTVNDPDGLNSASLQVGGAGVLLDISGSTVAELASKTYVDSVASGAFVIDTANPCSYNELQNAINAPKVILIKHEGVVYPFVEKWESEENTKRYVNIASLQRQGVDKGAMYFFFEATIGDFDSPMVYSSNYVQPTGKPYTDSVAGNLSDLTTTEKTNLVGAVNEVNRKIGVNMAVGKETWYGTYTDENDITYQVYSKTIYIPALPDVAGITTYEHGVSNIKQILSLSGVTTDGFVLNAPRQNIQDNIAIYQVSKSETNKTFSIEVGKDRSNKKAYVTMVYAKNN